MIFSVWNARETKNYYIILFEKIFWKMDALLQFDLFLEVSNWCKLSAEQEAVSEHKQIILKFQN